LITTITTKESDYVGQEKIISKGDPLSASKALGNTKDLMKKSILFKEFNYDSFSSIIHSARKAL
jgi:hypothetical protein